MNKTTGKTSFGFVTVIHVEGIGHCGGLLTLNGLGRPVEFHCTSPVPENRAQRILYGHTYTSFLYCEQIALALLGKTRRRPDMLLTNLAEMLPLQQLVPEPLLLVGEKECNALELETKRRHEFEIHDSVLSGPGLTVDELEVVRENALRISASIPIDEPFERIVQAIEEAQAVVR